MQLDVQGYDLRDLLGGHYLRYLVNYGSEPICKNEISGKNLNGETCVGLARSSNETNHEATWAGSCERRIRRLVPCLSRDLHL